MKNLLLLGILILGLSACGSPRYEKAIAKWIQTDRNGVWYDLRFDILELLEEKNITVSDSLQFWEERANVVKEYIKEHNPSGRSFGIFYSEEQCKADYDEAKGYLKRIEKIKEEYKNRNNKEVLARLLKCKYSIAEPFLKTRQEKTNTFLLTPDRSHCLGQMTDKNMILKYPPQLL